MSFPEILGLLTIKPLELLFENIYYISNLLIKNVAISIVALSLVVNLLVLPLYARADKIQKEATEKQKSMEKWVKHIRKTFRGEERLMMLQTYYRQNHYNPMSVLLESVPLLLQVPFFVAAYNFLSGLEVLQGMPLGPIRDLSAPDSLFMIGSFPVNVLPILMTLINIISGMIYTRNQPLKMKLQINGMAVLFLVLLYNSPSGLVFYWTCNNLFSLFKNLINEIIERIGSGKTVAASGSRGARESTGDTGDSTGDTKDSTGVAASGADDGSADKKDRTKTISDQRWVFFAGAAFLILLLGAYIPTNIIKASTQEFVEISNPQNPLHYVLYSTLYATGTFGIWLGIFYFLAGERGRRYFERGIWMVCGIGVTNYLIVGSRLGLISSVLQYSRVPVYGKKLNGISILISAAIIALLILIAKKNVAILRAIAFAGVLAMAVLTTLNIVKINSDYQKLGYLAESGDLTPQFTLSKNGKNVVLLMMDRALGMECRYIFKEKPELLESFDGFTYYPNTVSFGAFTNFGAPALYGGYEYTPAAMNARTEEPLVDKNDEALKVLPVLFSDNDYDVTVCDPPYAGYYWIPDLTIYDGYEKIKAYNTQGVFDGYAPEDAISKEEIRNRNFYSHSLMKIAPLFLQNLLYNSGFYNNPDYWLNTTQRTLYTSAGYEPVFMSWYLVLDNLNTMTNFEEDGDTFLMFTNGVTHEATMLQEPDYVPKKFVDNTPYHTDDEGRYVVDGVEMHMETIDQLEHFGSNVATYRELARWFDYLKANDCYDNTRIIIVSDHGRDIHHFDLTDEQGLDMEYFMPLLLVKDFNAHGFTVDESFMTNGDAPSMAVKDILENPVNPFTGNLLDGHEKQEEQKILFSEEWNTDVNNGNVFLPGKWYTVKENPYKLENWTYLGEY